MWKSIIAPSIVVSVIWLIVGGATSYYLSWQSQELDRVLDENVSSIGAAYEMQTIVWRMHAAVLQTDSQRSRIPDEVVRTLESQFDQSLCTAEASAKTISEQTLVKLIRERFTAYSTQLRQELDAAPEQSQPADFLPMISQIIEPCDKILQFNVQLVRQSSEQRRRLTAWIVWGRGAVLVFGPGLGLIMGFRLAQRLRHSMTNICISLQTVAGDINREIGRFEITPQPDLPVIQRQLDVITDRMRAVVRDLHEARRDAMRSERLAAVGELAAGVAHELRNPLTSVKLLIQTMQHRLRESMPHETFDVVVEEIGRMESTIQGLLDFARPPTLHRGLHDLSEIVKRAINLIEGKARQSGVTITFHPPVAAVNVNVDAEQLHQVCVNLLLNGIESMLGGGAFDVSVSADELEPVAQVRFEDTGTGIPARIIPRLFEPFATSKDHGTGLGLAVSRRIVMNHSGRLEAENRLHSGATFTIVLPLDQSVNQGLGSHANTAVD